MAMEVSLVDSMEDVVSDICFDFYGKRFAACALDRHIAIFDASGDPPNKTWTKTGIDCLLSTFICLFISSRFLFTGLIPRAHNDSIWRLSFAHPEFGHVLAACSEDGSVSIWEEQDRVTSSLKGEVWQRKALSGKS